MHPTNIEADADRTVTVMYRSDKPHEARIFKIIPHSIKFGRIDYGEQMWILTCTDIDRNVMCDLRMDNIILWSQDGPCKTVC